MRVKAGRAGANQPLQHGHVLAHQLSHFVNTLHQFVMDRLLHGAWHELHQVGCVTTTFLKRKEEEKSATCHQQLTGHGSSCKGIM